LLVKFLPLAYHHSHFLAATLDFTSFSQQGLQEMRDDFDSLAHCKSLINDYITMMEQR